jgi:hypothetical protein
MQVECVRGHDRHPNIGDRSAILNVVASEKCVGNEVSARRVQ